MLVGMIPHMRTFARSLCRDPVLADDLTQDALISALKGRQMYAAGTNLKAWLFTIVRNQFYSDKRRSWRVLALDRAQAEATLTAVSNPMAALELQDVRAAMMDLSDEQREALTLVSVAGRTYQEAAESCRCAIGTMKSRVSRARQALTAALAMPPLGPGRPIIAGAA